MALPTRKIGNDLVSAIGYGAFDAPVTCAMGIAAFYGKPDPDEVRLKFLDDLYASGCHFWDTADVYQDSEDLLGKWFQKTGKRKDIFLATKFGIVRQSGRFVNGSPEYAKQAIEKSLKRLGVDYVDLYYLHRPDPQVPIEETVTALAELVSAGKIRYIGLSEVSAATLRRAHAIHPIAAIQVEYSPFTLDIEDPKINLLNTARELGVTIIAYSPLGRGLITGQYKGPEDFDEDDFRRKVPRYSKENFPNILKLAEGLKQIGERHGATAGQVALAWLLAQGDDVIPIPGTRKQKYLEENLGALKLKLTPEEVAEVREVAKKADAANGPRYPPGFVETLFAETPAWK
ncbi:Aldo/keto reductase [Punctularia strigosozonata HHB-11173 SS5]|uniref:Aldo/keto reductase n=1 Tax=Punctularia strigosozonata (strain HHB-11173) TaxID=741275 RepID=UPI0004416AB1|nr:Aldo/keto reductase [Punctularia strigosozonata HHB-11173 SS5]EIN13062.1 Aldo/keto reductase [Punctularia strigosozonata HHB-11173 SS5]